MMRKLLSLALFSVLLLAAFSLSAKVRLNSLFGDNMVLQQQGQVSIWGYASPGKMLRVQTSWNHHNYAVRTRADGSFKLSVLTTSAGGPYEIDFNDGAKFALKNVLLGEVWVCSGQSNMEMPLAGWGKIKDYQKEINEADFPQIRLLQVKKAVSFVPLNEINSDGGWKVCSRESISEFSATAYFFAREIYRRRHVPVGLIHSSWGGTVAEAWTSRASLQTMPDFSAALQSLPRDTVSGHTAQELYLKKLAAYRQNMLARDSGYRDGKPVWALDSVPGAWHTLKVPGLWEDTVLPGFDGVVWLQKKIKIPAAWTGKSLKLSLGTIDDDDITFFNGVQIGTTEGYNKARNYQVPALMVKAGDAVITVRVTDTGGGGGIYGDPALETLGPAGSEGISLAGDWKYRPSDSFAKLPPPPKLATDPNQVTVLFNGMIHPLIHFKIKGVIWYQGESNASRAKQYQTLFPLMITDWRKNWHQGNFPFLFVQLANYMAQKEQPGESDWAGLREAQAKTLSLPATGMAVAIDIGEAADIHPKNKQEVGRRLALAALARVYGEPLVYSGPVYKSMKVEGRYVHVSFFHADSGLRTQGARALQGFAIAGADGKFYWAHAEIQNAQVVLDCPEVAQPLHVRYAWADNPVCNLYNGYGLPARPFRTDNPADGGKVQK